jgi:hypothetical protein
LEDRLDATARGVSFFFASRDKALIPLSFSVGISHHPKTMVPRPQPHAAVPSSLPPHLQEVCGVLAAGLIRLRTQQQKSTQKSGDYGESRLDFIPSQSGHANPSRKENV